MSDILASILLAQQRRRADPLDDRRKYGQMLMQQGASTAPVQSPWEGLARALTGGVGGFFAGQAERDQEEKDRGTIASMGELAAARTPDELQAALSKLSAKPGNMEVLGPVMAQVVSQRQQQLQSGVDADKFMAANRPGAMPVQGGGGPQVASAMPGGGVNQFNIGNVRPVGGGPNSGFQQPATWEDGVNLAVNNARAYPSRYNNGQPMTLLQIGERWAPRGDGANDPAQWARNVASIGGLPVDQPINLDDPVTAAAFARGVHGAEHGQQALRPPEAYQLAQARGVMPPQGDAAGGSSALTAPPDAPKPQPTQEQVQRYRDLIATGKMSVQQANQELNKELTTQWQQDNQRTMDVWKEQNTSRRQQEGQEAALGKDIAVNTLKDFNDKTRPQATAAITDIESIHQMRQLLDQGVMSGSFAPQREAMSRFAQWLGIPLGADDQANTAALRAAAGGRMGAIIKQYGSGTGISDADIRAATARIGGDTTQGEEAIRKILDVGEREARKTLSNYGVEVKRLRSLPQLKLSDEYYAVPPAPTFDEWSRANPTIRPQQPAAPQGTGAIREGATATNPQTGAKIVFRGGQWVPQ